MAIHNQVRLFGYVLNEKPSIVNEGEVGDEKVIFHVRTTHRNIDGYRDSKFQDIPVLYDGLEWIEAMKSVKKFDLVDIKGVFNVLSSDKRSVCPYCNNPNKKEQGTLCFVYPQHFIRLANLEGKNLPPDKIIDKRYAEVSNQALLVGTVVSRPERINAGCRYRLGINRKYYIKTQGDVIADYPWVYSFGKQAEKDLEHLKIGSVVLVDAFIRSRSVKAKITCKKCGNDYTYPDTATEFIPYAVEYLQNYITDEELAKKA